jgi:hypothetical protein
MMRRLENFLMRKIFCATTEKEILTVSNGKVVIDGKLVTENEIRQLKAEIKALKGFRIWEIVSASLKKDAQDRIFNHSVHLKDITFGKALLYSVDLQEKIMRIIDNL